MEAINIDYAQASFSQILSRIEQGEEIVLCDQGVAIATLVPFHNYDRRSSLGQDRSKFTVPDDFNDPLSEEILVAYEGNIE